MALGRLAMKINEVITEAGFLKGVARAIAPDTVDTWNSQKNAYTMQQTPATKSKSTPPQPIVVTTPNGIKVEKNPKTGKWTRKDNNTVVTDPYEISRLEQRAKNAKQVDIARGIKTF